MQKILAIGFALSVLVISGCGEGDNAAPVETEKPATTTTTATNLAEQQTAQAAYSSIISEMLPQRKAIDDQYLASVDSNRRLPWDKIPGYCGERVKVTQRFVELLENTVWPEQYQALVTDSSAKNSLVAELEAECAQLAGTETAQTANREQREAAYTSALAAAVRLREALGLPTKGFGQA
jgi:hypothetical protein